MGNGLDASRARARKDSLLMAAGAHEVAPLPAPRTGLSVLAVPLGAHAWIEHASGFNVVASKCRSVNSLATYGGFSVRHFSALS